MPQLIQAKVIGAKAVIRELHALRTTALPTNLLKGIFLNAMKPMLREAKTNARNVRKEKAQLTAGGKLAKRYTKSGGVSRSYKHKGGRHMAKALKLRKMKGNKFPGVNISVIQKYLPETKSGMRVGHMLEKGIKYKRGRVHFNQHPIYRAFKRHERSALKTVDKRIRLELRKATMKTPHIVYTNSRF